MFNIERCGTTSNPQKLYSPWQCPLLGEHPGRVPTTSHIKCACQSCRYHLHTLYGYTTVVHLLHQLGINASFSSNKCVIATSLVCEFCFITAQVVLFDVASMGKRHVSCYKGWLPSNEAIRLHTLTWYIWICNCVYSSVSNIVFSSLVIVTKLEGAWTWGQELMMLFKFIFCTLLRELAD